ncbi:hypothetical protein YC2023_036864 [Brassica napus]
MIFCSTACLTLWQSTSICLVISWKTELLAMCIAAWLSQCIVIGVVTSIPKSLRSPLIQINSLVSFLIALYSVSALEQDTTFYFLLFHVTKLPPMKVQYPVVDLLSTRSPAQSASQYPTISVLLLHPIHTPWPGASLRYLRIVSTMFQWCTLGACMCWLTWFTAKHTSGRVMVR